MSGFQYSDEIINQFPDIIGGIIMIRGFQNASTPPDLLALYETEQAKVAAEIKDLNYGELNSLKAWRSAFRSFGEDPTKYRSAPEALLRRLKQDKGIESINVLVDIGNLISIRYKLPISVINLKHVQRGITVRFAEGTEEYLPLGEPDTPESPRPGEVIFMDDGGSVLTRRWCWRQSEISATYVDTTDALITIEALHQGGKEEVLTAQGEMIELMNRYLSGNVMSGILSSRRRSIP